MADKIYRVTNPRRLTWGVRFRTQDAAWHRVLSLKGLRDTPENRHRLLAAGWRIRVIGHQAAPNPDKESA